MAKNYRIRVEALDGAESVIPEQWEKTTCEGFALLTFDGKHWEWMRIIHFNITRRGRMVSAPTARHLPCQGKA